MIMIICLHISSESRSENSAWININIVNVVHFNYREGLGGTNLREGEDKG